MKPRCKFCGGKVQWRGYESSNTSKRRRFQCKECGKWDSTISRHNRPARILLLDIETLPQEYYLWNPKQEFAQPEMQIKDWSIVCWAAKWLFEKDVMGQAVKPEDAVDRKDGSILKGIWDLVDEADIVVHQNGIRFDMPSLNTRWILHGYPPPSQYLNVDTLQIATRKFRFTYKRLEELGKKFGIGEKHEMHFVDWRNCLEGSLKDRKQAIQKQLDYCKNDVAPLLEDVYLNLLPWIDNHPNMNVYAQNDKSCCRNCASTDISWNGQYVTPQGLWQGWRCNSCGAIGRGTGRQHKEFGTHTK